MQGGPKKHARPGNIAGVLGLTGAFLRYVFSMALTILKQPVQLACPQVPRRVFEPERATAPFDRVFRSSTGSVCNCRTSHRASPEVGEKRHTPLWSRAWPLGERRIRVYLPICCFKSWSIQKNLASPKGIIVGVPWPK
jgi:hypothetical protein